MHGLDTKIETFFKLQKPQLAALKKLGIFSVQDALLYFPVRYLDFSKTQNLKDIKAGENVTVKTTIKSITGRFSFRGRISLAEAIVSDDTGSIKVVWFNQGYLAKSLKKGDEIFLAGAPEPYKGKLQFTNPIYEKVSDFPVHTSRLVPVYRLKNGLYPKTFRNLIKACLPLKDSLDEILPMETLEQHGLPRLSQTVGFSHFPESPEQAEAAKKRLAFEEIFINQLAAHKTRLILQKKKAHAIGFDQNLAKEFLHRLPFELTPGQKKAAWEILQDLQKNMPMNRLLEGDVGSGKTLVALMAAVQASAKGFQAVFLAPTEILAKQHFETAKKVVMEPKSLNFNTRCILLTQGYSIVNNKPIQKPRLREEIKTGMPGLYFGTHALLQKTVKFKKLALVIIDEQHRWGVEQRAKLIQSQNRVPHLLSLSATPIPRTLKLAMFGELDISQIKTKPKDRKPINTRLVEPDGRAKAYQFLSEQISLGRQAFVITPLIEESDVLGVKAAKLELAALQKTFPGLKIGLLHGKMKSKEKEAAMADFLANRTQILVATSVVEVGVDVPNASVMVIEGAERFGLSQLHQFRGRVGRAEHQSYCLLFTSNEKAESRNRLETFSKISDGFELAEADLKSRGFGELYGQTQAGWNLKYFDPAYLSLVEPAKQAAMGLLKENFDLERHPELNFRIKDKIIHFE